VWVDPCWRKRAGQSHRGIEMIVGRMAESLRQSIKDAAEDAAKERDRQRRASALELHEMGDGRR